MTMFDWYTTERGFAGAIFKDDSGIECSIQQRGDGEARIWLGINEPKPRMVRDGKWVDCSIDVDAYINGRMSLDQKLAAELIPVLQHFVDTGILSEYFETSDNPLVEIAQNLVKGSGDMDAAEVQDIEDDDEMYTQNHADFSGLDDDDDDLEDYKQFTKPEIDPQSLKRDLTKGVNAAQRVDGEASRPFAMRDALLHRVRCLDPTILTDEDIGDLRELHSLLDAIEERHGIKADSKQRRAAVIDQPPRYRSD